MLTSDDGHEPRERVLACEQRELGEAVVEERGANTVRVPATLKVTEDFEATSVREDTFHDGVFEVTETGVDVILQHPHVFTGYRIKVRLLPQDIAHHWIAQ